MFSLFYIIIYNIDTLNTHINRVFSFSKSIGIYNGNEYDYRIYIKYTT